jgi:ApaG protein
VPGDFEEIKGLVVEVDDVIYMPSLDAPPDRPHPFVYFINIRNGTAERITIIGRKWLVREDGNEEVMVVEGDGVVGQTPTIEPGDVFSYNSYHVARGTSFAEGAFFGRTESGQRVVTRIPRFTMSLPDWV